MEISMECVNNILAGASMVKKCRYCPQRSDTGQKLGDYGEEEKQKRIR